MIVGNLLMYGGIEMIKKNNKENLKIISVEVSKELLEKLSDYAEKNYLNKSSVIRLALKDFLNK